MACRFERLDKFVATREASADSLVDGPAKGETILPADGVMLWYGGDGTAKTRRPTTSSPMPPRVSTGSASGSAVRCGS